MSIPTQGYITRGLSGLPSSGPILSGGFPVTLNPTPKLNPSEDPSKRGIPTSLTPNQIADLVSLGTIRNTEGNAIVPTRDGFISLGGGFIMEFDPDTAQGKITPALSPSDPFQSINTFGGMEQTYTGADCRLLIEVAETAKDGRRYAKQLLEATTISVSVHREVSPVRAGGYINPKGFALGKRTIAGSLIMTQGTVDVFLRFLHGIMIIDGSKDTFFTKVDQLPPFNITMILTNEAGYASQRRLLGVKFVTDGVVYSIQDMIVEQMITWMALDFTPLMPLTSTGLYQAADPIDPTIHRERTPMDFMRQGEVNV